MHSPSLISLTVFATLAAMGARTARCDDVFDPRLAEPAPWEANDDAPVMPSEPLIEYGMESGLAFPATALSFTWLAPGGNEGFGAADFDLHQSWQIGLNHPEPLVVTPGIGLHLWSGPGVLDLPPRVYDLYLDLSWRFLNRGAWGMTGGITPGFYGDFERIDGDAFQFTGWLMADWAVNDRWTLLGGVAYVRQLKSNLLPVGGVVWHPNEDLRVEITVPRPRIARRVYFREDAESWAYVSGQFGGGAWAVDAGDENVLLQYSDFRLCAGFEWVRIDGRATTIELGYVFNRDIAVDEFSVLVPDGTALLQWSASF